MSVVHDSLDDSFKADERFVNIFMINFCAQLYKQFLLCSSTSRHNVYVRRKIVEEIVTAHGGKSIFKVSQLRRSSIYRVAFKNISKGGIL